MVDGGGFNTRYKAVEEFNAAIKLGRENKADEEVLNRITCMIIS